MILALIRFYKKINNIIINELDKKNISLPLL